MKNVMRTEAFDLLDQDEMLSVNGGIGFAAGLVIGLVLSWAANAIIIGLTGTTPDQAAGGALYDAIHPGEVHVERQSTGGGGRY